MCSKRLCQDILSLLVVAKIFPGIDSVTEKPMLLNRLNSEAYIIADKPIVNSQICRLGKQMSFKKAKQQAAKIRKI
ncbi:hypothetical protein IQ272_05280 [Chroococcidiopsidales cyanobacterium LEGE 13417]|nr:hypothetical protein [Chroococcidiopsidales cyanobacterium LEGE 13417]